MNCNDTVEENFFNSVAVVEFSYCAVCNQFIENFRKSDLSFPATVSLDFTHGTDTEVSPENCGERSKWFFE